MDRTPLRAAVRPTLRTRLRTPSPSLRRLALLAMLALAFVASSAVAQRPLVLEGRIPSDAPGGVAVEARIGTDLKGMLSEPVAVGTVEEGRFRLELPAAVDAELLEAETVDCARERTIDAVFLPHLTLVQDDEAVGRLVHTDVPRQLWGYAGPPRSASWAYTLDTLAVDESCGAERLDLAFVPGWNPFVVLTSADATIVTTDDPPAGFRWVFVPAAE